MILKFLAHIPPPSVLCCCCPSADEPPAGADGVVSVSVEGGGIGGPKVERRFLRTDPLTAVYGLVRMKLAEKHLARAATPGVSVSSEAAVRQIELASPGGFVLKLVSSGQARSRLRTGRPPRGDE